MTTPFRLKTLLVDDDRNIRHTLQVSLTGMFCDVRLASSGDDAIRILSAETFDFMLTDFRMEGQSGIDVLRALRTLPNPPIAVVMTAFASFENAVNAIKEGAFDYLPKPFSRAQLSHVLQKVRALSELKKENAALKRGSSRINYFRGMTSPGITRLEEFVNKIAPTQSTVLMTGESGTGKSELARVIHERSTRSGGPFVIINCSSLADPFLESKTVLSGDEGVSPQREGNLSKFELANLGTVFLDEIGDLSSQGQTRLLRILQEKMVERAASGHLVPVDVRVIAATHRSLEDVVKDGVFREDLYYRLNTFECALVPLRHRPEDIAVLIEKFLCEFSIRALENQPKKMPEEVLKVLLSYQWPGNIRELSNVIERLVLLSRDREIEMADLPETIRLHSRPKGGKGWDHPVKTLEEVEREQIQRVLSMATSQEHAASILGITTVTLWRKRKQFGLP